MLSEKDVASVKALEVILFRNKTGNYTLAPMRLLAYLIVVFGEVTSATLTYDGWLKENFTNVQFKRSIAFLKEKGILQRLVSRQESTYKINYQFLNSIVSGSLNFGALLEIKEILANPNRKDTKVSLTKHSTLTTLTVRTVTPKEKEIYIKKKKRCKLKVKKLKRKGRGSRELLQGIHKDLSERAKKAGRTRKKRRLRKDSPELYLAYRFNPSENPKLQSWRARETEEWRSVDFLGFYICLYREHTGFENISLQDESAYNKIKRAIRMMLVSWFNGDRSLFRQFLEWGVEYFANKGDERYVPSISTLLNPYKKTQWVYDAFVKSKRKKKHRKDHDWASSKKWR